MAEIIAASPEKADEKVNVLTEAQLKIFDALDKKDGETLKKVLEENPKLDVNFLDDHKMSPIQHSAYKGMTEATRLLIDRGADVDRCEHEYDYTALHFGALSGNVEVCLYLLDAGAKTTLENSVGRTAAQMAGFVGNHSVVSTINNYLPKSDVLYYSKPQGIETTPLLEPEIAERIHKFALLYNLHPLRVAIELQNNNLLEFTEVMKKVLILMMEREMKRKQMNEVLSFKFYYLSFMVTEIGKVLKTRTDGNSDEKSFVDILARKLLKANKEGQLEYLDQFLRECIREYPYRDSSLFVQMVTSLASGKDAPPAISVLHSAINGQRAFAVASDEASACQTCGATRTTKRCGKCRMVGYCDRECQRLHWFAHKKVCARAIALGDKAGSLSPSPKEKIDTSDLQAELSKALTAN